jgi:hypothetical protein
MATAVVASVHANHVRDRSSVLRCHLCVAFLDWSLPDTKQRREAESNITNVASTKIKILAETDDAIGDVPRDF